jgi:hypothetical protein
MATHVFAYMKQMLMVIYVFVLASVCVCISKCLHDHVCVMACACCVIYIGLAYAALAGSLPAQPEVCRVCVANLCIPPSVACIRMQMRTHTQERDDVFVCKYASLTRRARIGGRSGTPRHLFHVHIQRQVQELSRVHHLGRIKTVRYVCVWFVCARKTYARERFRMQEWQEKRIATYGMQEH